MKKLYIQPQVECVEVESAEILAGSLEVKAGSTSEQNAKSVNMSFGYDEDYEEND